MSANKFARKSFYLYLQLLPFLVTFVAFVFGHSPYRIYIPLWLIHSAIMLTAIVLLGFSALTKQDKEKQQWLIIALLLVLPWVFIVIFAGMGPPPRDPADWVKTSTEQQWRYIILIASGISFTLGLGLLREKLRAAGELFYSQLGYTAILIAIPFFIINMTYLGSYLAVALPHFIGVPPAGRPDWYLALRARFIPESAVQVSMTYVASACFAASLKIAGLFNRSSAKAYIAFSLLGFILALMPPDVPDALAIPGYIVSIPAITFLMPYLMGLQFLSRAGS